VLKTLGKLSLEGVDFKQSRPLLLLAYLSIEGPQDRRHLAELFWPNSKNALSNLTTVLSRLNKLDDSLVTANEQQISTHLNSDVKELLNAESREDNFKVIELYKGRFLEGFYLKDVGSELEEWLYLTREKLATKVRLAKLSQAESKAEKGLFKEAAQQAEQAYLQKSASEPNETDLKRIYTLLTLGDSQLVNDVEKEAQSYGLNLCQTKEEILQAFSNSSLELSNENTAPKPTQSKPYNLPKQASSFVGREQELSELQEQLEHENTQLVTLIGSGGMGKTRLALKVAEQLYKTKQFPDGVFFVALAPLGSSDLVAQAIAEALDLSLFGASPPEEQVINQIQSLNAFIILDNFEHLLDGSVFISNILQASPKLKLLITSRERLQLPEEWIYNLWGLSKEETNTQTKAFKDAVNLFEQRAKQVIPSFNLEDDYEHVFSICKSVEGMPLGIELAASWTNTISTQDIAQEIQESTDFLEANSKHFTERHRTLSGVMNYSWQRLSEQEQAVFKKLSVFRGGFDYTAAKQIANAKLKDLANLTNKSLIRFQNNRYEIHELLRQFAFEQLAKDQQELSSSEEKHAYYFADFINEQESSLKGIKQKAALKSITLELDNILLAWEWAVKNENTESIDKIAFSFCIVCEMQGWNQLGIATLNKALPLYRKWIAKSSDSTLEAGFVMFLTGQVVCFFRIDISRAIHVLKEAEPYINSLKSIDPLKYAFLLGGKSLLLMAIGNFDKSLKLSEEAKDIALLHKDEWTVGWIGVGVADTLGLIGENQEGILQYQQSIEAYARIGEQRAKSYALNNLGRIFNVVGRFDEAKENFEAAWAIREDFNDKTGIISSQFDLGKVETRLGHYDTAYKHLSNSLKSCINIKSNYLAQIQHALAQLAINQDDFKNARTKLKKALVSSAATKSSMPRILNDFAYLELLEGNVEQASTYLQDSLVICEEINIIVDKAQALAHMGFLELLKQPNESENAKKYLLQALRLTQTSGAAPLALSILVNWTQLETTKRSIALLSLVKHDNHSEFAIKEKASQRLNELQNSEGFEEAVEQGRKLELWDVVSELVN